MAKESDDCEFWLPPQFLNDDDDLFTELKGHMNDGRNGLGFGGEYQRAYSSGFFGFGSNSDLSSPVDGSTETESDEEDYITELTRKISRSTLLDSGLAYENRKGWSLSGSPQSTLCSALGGCDCNQGSSRCSPNGPSRVASPPEASRTDGAWELLYAAAGEVARMRMAENGAGFQSKNNGLYAPRKPFPVSVPRKSPSPIPGFQPGQPHPPYQHLKALQFEQLKQQQLMKHGTPVWGQQKHQLLNNQQMLQHRERIAKPAFQVTAWPTLEQSHRQQIQPQPQPSSGMRAVFLGNPVSKRECAGTGVFLPRRFGAPTETRKKPGCSTVLLPDRVVHALNLNLAAAESQVHNRYNGSFGNDHDYSTGKPRNAMRIPQAQQKRTALKLQSVINSPEVRLPQEWTY